MDQEIRQKLEQWLQEHFVEMIRDISTLVAVPSVAQQKDDEEAPFGVPCRRALDEALKLAARYGFQTCNYENRCGSVTLRPGNEEIAFWGHLDVVPPGDGWLLTTPFEPVLRDGYLIGRGTDDNKGPAVGILYLLRAFEELHIPTRHGLRLFLGCDEEAGMRDVEYYTSNYPASKLVMIPDCGFPVCYGEKGIVTADIVTLHPMADVLQAQAGSASNIVPAEAQLTLRGEAPGSYGEWVTASAQSGSTSLSARGLSRHSAFPEGGVNAIHQATGAAVASGLLKDGDLQAMQFFTRINDDYLGTELDIAGTDELSGYTTCTGTMLSLRKDGRMALHVNIRSHITADPEQMLEQMTRRCGMNGCTLENVTVSRGNYFPRENPIVDGLAAVYHKMTGSEAKPYVMGGGTYARKLPHALGFGLGGLPREETTLFAPGHGSAHQPDEGLHVENLRKALLIFGMGILEADKLLP